MYTALLDSWVLWTSTQRDLLLSLAIKSDYCFVSSEATLGEIEVNEEIKRSERGDSDEVAREKAQHLATQMQTHFGDSLIHGWEGLEGMYGHPDPGNEHVLSVAVVGGTGSIVTDNFRDLPKAKFLLGVQFISPQGFAHESVGMGPESGLAVGLVMTRRIGKTIHDNPQRNSWKIWAGFTSWKQ